MLVSDIVQKTGGLVHGDDSQKVAGVATFEASKSDNIVFVLDRKNLPPALSSKAKIILVADNILLPSNFSNKVFIRVKNPRLAMAKVLALFVSDKKNSLVGVHNSAVISPKATVGKNIQIHANCFVGANVRLGDNTTLFPNVVIYDDVDIGSDVIIHSGVVVGSDGFGFIRENKNVIKIPQLGKVIIENNVEIGANTTVDRATIGATIIGSYTKIDNQVQISHNCKIGSNCIIAASCAIAGSSIVGDNVTMGGCVAISDHVEIGNNVVIAGRSGVTKNIPSDTIVSGFPARDHKKELHFWSKLRQFVKTL